jgi:predicted AlkP superfamily phosphohydrolase/phosphomutase
MQSSSNKYSEAILHVYQHADRTLGDIIHYLPENMDLVVMSDHGFGPATTNVFYPNKWLLESGLLHLKDNTFNIRRSPLKGIKRTIRQAAFSIVRGSKRFLIRTLPSSFKEKLLELSGLRSYIQSFILLSQMDWAKTKAFSDEIIDGIWINVKDREPSGIISPGKEYENVRDDIIRRLKELRDPYSGSLIIDTVYKREDLFHGSYLWKAPDILFSFKDDAYRIRPSNTTSEDSRQGVFGNIDSEGRTSGSHRREGVFFLWGKNFKRDCELENIQITDIAPTVLHHMGVPVPEDMDGRVLTEAFEKTSKVTYQSPEKDSDFKPSGDYSSEESKQIEDRLKAIGYIE